MYIVKLFLKTQTVPEFCLDCYSYDIFTVSLYFNSVVFYVVVALPDCSDQLDKNVLLMLVIRI